MGSKNERLTGLVRKVRRLSENAQRERLKAAGCARIFDWSEMTLLLKGTRQGDVTAVCVAHVLGHSQAAIRDTMKAILAKRSGIFVLDTGLHTDKPEDAAQIALDAIAGLTSDRRTHSTATAKRAGKQAWKAAREKRMPKPQAAKVWHAPKNRKLNNADRLKLMTGWSLSRAYAKLGRPGDPLPDAFEPEE